ncbi:MAG TPA: LacI family DNA-binding transcriptional regulator [Blastocatellia bacterium]|nr:LacI family DNA-binding transcriptional regulator [Blastocatellia bacterium]
MPVTLADIAEALGISMMTVSRAINNSPVISAETRARVLEAADRMGYRPNHQARGLATNRSFLIGLVVPDLTHSYFAELAKAIESVVRPTGYEVLICNTEEDGDRELAEVNALRHRTDGLIIASSISQSKAEVYRKLIGEGARLVFLDRHFGRIGSPAAVTNNIQAGMLVTEHLIELGYRRIGHLRGTNVSVANERLEGYRRALRKHGLEVDDRLIRPCGLFQKSGYEAMRAWIAEGDLPRAIFAVNDPAAIGAMSALLEAKIRVPAQVAIAGAGAVQHGELLRIPLTTVDWDLAEMGRQAARLLIETIEGQPPTDGQPRNVVINPELIVRRSCGAIVRKRPGKKSGR